MSEYVAALQGGLRAVLHQKHDYDGKVQRREYQAGELVWIHDITLERTRGTKLQFPWFGPALITKVLDRGRVVVRRKQAARSNASGSSGDVPRDGRASVDDDGTA